MLTLDTKKKLLDSISKAPCSIQELAFELDKNWRTVDGYIAKLVDEGLVKIKEFKKGSRVSFKIVFMQPDINHNISNVQKEILAQIDTGQRSQDFSSLNLVQYIDDKNIKAYYSAINLSIDKITYDLNNFLNKAQSTILMFSGDLSWVDLHTKKSSIIETLKELAKQKINIKILARVDLTTKKRIEKLMRINTELGFNTIEIRHKEHPLRCFIIDGKTVRLKEPAFESIKGKLEKVGTYFYEFSDIEWSNWLEKVFWNKFRTSVSAEKRLELLDNIEKLKKK